MESSSLLLLEGKKLKEGGLGENCEAGFPQGWAERLAAIKLASRA
jgi:hypothetical protein